MIYTCTLNPSIDYIVKTPELTVGGLNRATQSMFYPGGKGINVSRVLKRLGADSTALGFAGGFTGDFVKSFLADEGIIHDFTLVNEPTRINVKVKANEETEINGHGPDITAFQQEELFRKIAALDKEDVLIIAGSIPSSLPSDFYTLLTKQCNEKDVRVIIDTSGSALRETFPDKPFLIKPNHHELGELFNTVITSAEEAAAYGKKLLDEGVRNVIVSMAGDGAVFVNKEKTLFANVPKGEVKNSVGSGDSLVAGFIGTYLHSQNLEEAFRTGVAAGSATAFSDDLCTRETVENLKQQVTVKNLG
ncbi:1-phosphofructokinase [Metabacillus sp. GX 13764]|uniref:1-phosphofructokinase n=1 Tax=Metabacillus kandeliae TaxID=2900151 RepID=UPI001E52C4E1|nr:1-phosphofructokinase [Metabacillus kandeliae]MCD7032739.1 1-phosphofructokinase [Metabacillus kandeliae]